MKRIAISWVVGVLAAISCLPLSGQAPSTNTGGDANPLLSAISNAVWSGTPVKSIQFSGNATWRVGSEIEQGTVTASADNSGNSSLQISGDMNRLETETAIAPERVCQWSGSNNQTHAIGFMNCLKPIGWLFPALTLQPNRTPTSAGFLDLGLESVSAGKLRHLQAEVVDSTLPSKMLAESMRRSTMDLGVDPTTFLPTMLTYQVYPDNGPPLNVAIEIRYSDYRKIGTAEIPFHIQRYINGALQLDLQITSVTLS